MDDATMGNCGQTAEQGHPHFLTQSLPILPWLQLCTLSLTQLCFPSTGAAGVALPHPQITSAVEGFLNPPSTHPLTHSLIHLPIHHLFIHSPTHPFIHT
jgi:hypothetical protein